MHVTHPPDELALFPAKIRLPVQWGDQDAFGHVNNIIYFRWFESARIAYLERIGLGEKHEGKADSGENIGPILAAIGCNYRKQVKYPDTVIVGARIVRIGRFQNDGDYLFVPPVFLAPTFLVMVVYRATRASVLTTPGFTVTAYSEWAEFCLAFGLFAYVGLNYRRYAMANAMQEAAVISVAPAMPVPVAAQPETVRIS